MKRAAALVPSLFLHSAAPAATIIDPLDDPTVTAQQYRDEAALFPSVGKVAGSGFSGSGVAIGDRWVLTAGHVSLSKTGGTFELGGETFSIERSITHPAHILSTSFSDLGLLFLDRPVTSIQSATLFRRPEPASILGNEATWVGHGFSGTGRTGAQLPVELRAFTNIIDVFGSHPGYGLSETSFVCDFDQPGNPSTNAPASAASATRLEGNVSTGDSGGGVFMVIGGQVRLIGISSYSGRFGPGSAGIYGHLSGATDLALFHDWIEAETGIAAVPEPASLLLAAAGMLTCLRRRR